MTLLHTTRVHETLVPQLQTILTTSSSFVLNKTSEKMRKLFATTSTLTSGFLGSSHRQCLPTYELRERVLRRVFTPAYIETSRQLADVLTKAMRVGSHVVLLDRLLPMVVGVSSSAAGVPAASPSR